MATVKSLLTRLNALEGTYDKVPDKGEAFCKLTESMRKTYDRVQDTNITADWLNQQSQMTALSIAMHCPLPFSDPLKNRLVDISGSGGRPGKLAHAMLGVAERCEELSLESASQ